MDKDILSVNDIRDRDKRKHQDEIENQLLRFLLFVGIIAIALWFTGCTSSSNNNINKDKAYKKAGYKFKVGGTYCKKFKSLGNNYYEVKGCVVGPTHVTILK